MTFLCLTLGCLRSCARSQQIVLARLGVPETIKQENYLDPQLPVQPVVQPPRAVALPFEGNLKPHAPMPKKNEEVELPQTWGSTSVQPKVGTDRFLVSKEFNLSNHSMAISVRAY